MIQGLMKTKLSLALFFFAITFQVAAQRACSSFSYQQQEIKQSPSLAAVFNGVETFTRQYLSDNNNAVMARTAGGTAVIKVIKIPVVVHILYHGPSENISDAKVMGQLDILNRAFRRTNADTTKTPSRFKAVAADCEIEFQLAVSDPRSKNTSGIIRKYTPISVWEDNDKMKFSSEMGDDAWDSRSYLNIWVCNLDRVAGYATMPGGPAEKDGIVLDFPVFGTGGAAGFDMGKTAVHEVGHWLNLKHLWGDDYCGDDGVNDTPKQGGYNSGCPSGIQLSCGTDPNGDMYMNYMDFTSDACMNLFTLGQKARMRALFVAGGARNAILLSKGLQQARVFESPLPDQPPTWLHYQLYPNPASNAMTLDLAYDIRWIGKTLRVLNLQGQLMMQVPVSSKIQRIDISQLKPGMYFLVGKKDDGDFIQQKFIKL
jgi:Pregnancy-associated plasma protein-A/Secretion system C-terminal sorting domain